MSMLRWISMGVFVASLLAPLWPGLEPKVVNVAMAIGMVQALLVLFALEYQVYRQRRKEAQEAQGIMNIHQHAITHSEIKAASITATEIQNASITPAEAVPATHHNTITEPTLEASPPTKAKTPRRKRKSVES